MEYLQQLIFLAALGGISFGVAMRIRRIRQNVLMGRPEERKDQKKLRLRNMLLVALGQRKMFKRPAPAIFHFFIYAGFLLINIEVLEIVIDGIVGSHRIFTGFLGGSYTVMINFFEGLALLVLLSCMVFLARREIMHVRRFWKSEMRGWPRLDAALILLIEAALMVAILAMDASDQVLQSRQVPGYPDTGVIYVSSLLAPMLDNLSTLSLIIVERACWWFHIIGILGFALYITYSKHLHIALAFPAAYFSRLAPKGKMDNMPEVTAEVQSMLGQSVAQQEAPQEIPRLGARDVQDLSWKNLLDAYTCTECGRCTSECPANLTGKKLSPRKILMDTRDRLEEAGRRKAKGLEAEDGKSLLGDYISAEELNACTTCNACTEACPINLDPLSIILQLRRYMAMEESASPAEWNMMFSNIETSFSPWKFPPSDRFNWAGGLRGEGEEENA
ncbi:MAG: (Fe-S)-binding protein [Cytophagales bacterium]|nr:(Fe-S)-binding protein [Cytophagales bacterium]